MDDHETVRQRKQHVCTVCGYSTRYTTSMKKHLSKVLPCGNVSVDDSRYIKMVDIYVHGNKPPKETTFSCDCCNKLFKSRTSVYRHAKICTGQSKLTDEVRILKEEVRKLKEEPRLVQNIVNNNNNVTNNVSVYNTISFNNYGSEKLDHILNKTELLDQCVRRRDKGHGEFIEYVHLRTPENRNIMNSNRRNTVLVVENGEWVHKDKDDVQQALIQSSCEILTNHFETHKRRFKRHLSDCLFHDIIKYFDQVNEGNLDIELKLKDKINEIIDMMTKCNNKQTNNNIDQR